MRDSVLVLDHAIGDDDLRMLADYIRQARMSESLVSNVEAEDAAGVEWKIDKRVRDTQDVELTSALRDTLARIHDVNVRAHINPFYGIEVRDAEPFQILHYGVGGHYVPHVDAETLFKDEIGLDMWEKTLDRDLSIVYFLNDDFEGGALQFPSLDLSIAPRAGTLVCFPSDHHFIHGVNPVTAGRRYTLVTWMRVAGTPSPEEINQAALDAYHEAWPQQIDQPSRLLARGET